MLYQKALDEYRLLQQQANELQTAINKLPKGKLICSQGKNCIKWYVSDGHKQTYLPKKKRKLAEQLAVKKYLTTKLEYTRREMNALDFYMRHAPKQSESAAERLMDHAGYRELLLPYCKPKDQRLKEWMEGPFEKNEKYPEKLLHKTTAGIYVRSKSESMIALALQTNHIPFRYECALSIDGITLYPDFTILHPETMQVYYWEHFGRMDDPAYVDKTVAKLQLYASRGIIPTIQLIDTYETLEHPLTFERISNLVSHYFL